MRSHNYLDSLRRCAAHLLWLGSGVGSVRQFSKSLHNPRKTQETLLFSLLRRNASADYGKRFGFERIRSIREYQESVPVIDYDTMQNEIERIKSGEQGVLTEEPVLMFEKTSGSTAPSKYIPYTASLRREFQAAVSPWMFDLYRHRSGLLFGSSYWSVSPLAQEKERTSGGLPIGFEEDTEYFGNFERKLLRSILSTPVELPRITDIDASRYVTLLFMLQSRNLAFISVWNPSFLTLLIDFLHKHEEILIHDLERGALTLPSLLPVDLKMKLQEQLFPNPKRAKELKRLLVRDGKLNPVQVWPKLRLISCWTNVSAEIFVPEMMNLFPNVEIQPKGLLSTEGVISIPLTGYSGAPLAVTSHFLEFLDEESPDSKAYLIDELEVGKTYTTVISTGGGLYRYRVGDRVKVVGHVQAVPLVEFLGSANHISDLCGEKLHESLVNDLLQRCFSEFGIQPIFAMLAPERLDPPAYILFAEAQNISREAFAHLLDKVEAELSLGHHYAYCRRLGQLGRLKGFLIHSGANQAFFARCLQLGQRQGNIKPTTLRRETGWLSCFNGEFVDAIVEKKNEPICV